MKRKIIAFDLDGVISNFDYAFSQIANQMYGTKILKHPDEVEHWNFELWYGLTKEELDNVWEKIKNTENFWLNNIRPLNEFIIYNINDLQQKGHTIYFISSRLQTKGMSVVDQTFMWLLKYCADLNPHIIITHQKGQVLNALRVDYFIDDKLSNIIDALKNSPHTKSFLLCRRHNKELIKLVPSYFYKNKAIIVSSVKEFIDYIESREGENNEKV